MADKGQPTSVTVTTHRRKRCLICYSDLTDSQIKTATQFRDLKKSSSGHDSNRAFTSVPGESPALSKQLYAFFLLRNVLELLPKRLEKKLQKEGSLDSWFKLCEPCNKEIQNVKKIYIAFQTVSKKYKEAKWKIQKKIRNSKSAHLNSTIQNEGEAKTVAVKDAVDLCRDVICKRKGRKISKFHYSSLNPFIEGDQRANQLLLETQKRKITSEVDSFGEVPRENDEIYVKTETETETEVKIESQTNEFIPLSCDPLADELIETEVDHASVNASPGENYDEPSSPSPSNSSTEWSESERKNKADSESGSKIGQDSNPPTFTCDHCEKSFSHHSSLGAHIRVKHPEVILKRKKAALEAKKERLRIGFTCDKCGRKFPSKYNLLLHTRRIHGEVKRIQCEYTGCTKSYADRRAYKIHLLLHQGKPAPHKCSMCNLSFRMNWGRVKHEMNAHKHVNTETLEETWKCLGCDEHFPEKHILEEHYHSSCSKVRKVLKLPCAKCDQTFSSKRALRLHVYNKHEKTKFQCTICPISKPGTHSRLHLHMAKHHGIDSDRYKCKICGKMNWSISPKQRLKCCSTESTTGTMSIDKLRICEFCGKAFKSTKLKSLHVKVVHAKASQVCCELCGKSLCTAFSLARHMAITHKIGKVKCEEEGCDKVFECQKSLEKHVKFKHKGEPEPRPFTCTYCGRKCFTSVYLREHVNAMHIYKDSKPFKCADCDKTFATETRLKRHRQNVHEKQVKVKGEGDAPPKSGSEKVRKKRVRVKSVKGKP